MNLQYHVHLMVFVGQIAANRILYLNMQHIWSYPFHPLFQFVSRNKLVDAEATQEGDSCRKRAVVLDRKKQDILFAVSLKLFAYYLNMYFLHVLPFNLYYINVQSKMLHFHFTTISIAKRQTFGYPSTRATVDDWNPGLNF